LFSPFCLFDTKQQDTKCVFTFLEGFETQVIMPCGMECENR
jgi:hypothetical protein